MFSPNNVVDSPKGPSHHRPTIFLERFRDNPFGEPYLACQSDSRLADRFGESSCSLSFCIFLELFLTFYDVFADVSKTKVVGKDILLYKRSKGITIHEDETTSWEKANKLPTIGGNGKGNGRAPVPASPKVNSDSDGVYATYLTTSKSEGEHQYP